MSSDTKGASVTDRRRVLVIGGGLAGLAAAVAIAEHGWRVTLLESRPRLGGRASSFLDPASGELADNCQHVSMGACTNLADFCRRVGIDRYLTRQPALYFQDESGYVSRLRPARLPAPLHLLPDLVRARFLSFADKLRIARGFWALLRTPHDDTGRSFYDWLRTHGQTRRTCERFWGLILTSALNESLENIDFRFARQVFIEGFVWNRAAGIVEIPTVPLSVLYGERLSSWLADRGVEVRLNTAAAALEFTDGRVAGCRLRTGELVDADEFVLAVPFQRVAGLVPPEIAARLPFLQGLAAMETVPIVSVHLWYDRPVLQCPHLVMVGRTIQWLFRRPTESPPPSPSSTLAYAREDRESPPPLVGEGQGGGHAGEATLDPRPQYLQAVISAARELAELGNDRILELVQAEIAESLPAARQARLLHHRVVTERQATFSVRPGIDRLRPAQQTPIENLWLAGDYTQTGWPATMEGAVKSGYLAVEALLRHKGQPASLVQPPLPLALLTRLVLRRAVWRHANFSNPI